MPEPTLKGSLEDFMDWCRDRGHYNSVTAVERYQEYKRNQEKTKQVVRRAAVDCED